MQVRYVKQENRLVIPAQSFHRTNTSDYKTTWHEKLFISYTNFYIWYILLIYEEVSTVFVPIQNLKCNRCVLSMFISFFFYSTTDEDIRLEYMILRQYERTKIRILIHFYRNWTQKLKNRISYPYQRWTQNFKNAQCTFCVLHKWVATLQKTRKDAKLNKV